MRTFKTYSQQLSNMKYSIINYSSHTVHYIPWLIYFITGSLYLLTPFNYLAHPSCPASGNHQSVNCIYDLSFLLLTALFFVCKRLRLFLFALFYFILFYFMVRTQYDIYSLNKFLSVQYIIHYRYNIVQQISRAYLSCLTETLCPLINNSPFPSPSSPGNHHFTLWFYEFEYFR